MSYLFHRQYYEILYNITGDFGAFKGFMIFFPLLIIISSFIQCTINYFCICNKREKVSR